MNKPFLIAEIGINHNGDLSIAKSLIQDAAKAGFDAVKFQKRNIDSVYTKEFLNEPRDSPFGRTQRDQKEGLEFNYEDYKMINDFCLENNIEWFASAWDVKSQEFFDKFDLKYNKIASPMLTNIPLLEKCATQGRYTFISTGMSSYEEIDKAVEIFRNYKCPFELMHAVSSYPLPQNDANLLTIKSLAQKYNCDVGYSGHETCLIKVCILAVAIGATSIERHITLDRAMYGSDQACSIETKALPSFVNSIRSVKAIMGDGEKKILENEIIARNKLRYFEH